MTKAPTAVICLSPYQGGMEIDALKLSQMLSEISNVTLIVQKDKFIAQNYKKLSTPPFSLSEISFKKSLSPSIIFGVRKIIQEMGIKNVLFLGASELKSLYFSFLGLEINLIIRHGTTKSSPKKDWFHRLIYSKVNYHIAICEHLGRNVEYIIPFGKETQLKVIYPSLNITQTQEIDFEAKPHQPLQLLHVGRIADGKGQIAAIKACSVLHDNNIDFNFNLVGGFHEPYKQQFLDFLDQVPYKDKITLVGHTDKVESYYLSSDIFLFPSDGEGLSNAFIEALYYGLSCIAYDNTSFKEILELGFTFKLIPNQDLKSLQSSLLDLNKKTYKKETLQYNHTLISKYFSPVHELNAFNNILKG